MSEWGWVGVRVRVGGRVGVWVCGSVGVGVSVCVWVGWVGLGWWVRASR